MLARCLLVAALLALGARPTSCGAAGNVMVLTAKNFDEWIASHAVVLVEFYAPWCGHCQRLAPEFAQAAAELASEGILLGQVDATEEKELADRFGVQGYPTLKVFHSGTPYDYEGPREAAGIVSYMQREARPDWEPPQDPVLVLTQHNFTSVLGGPGGPVLVEFFAPWCGHCKRLAPEFRGAATDLRRMRASVRLAKVDVTEEVELAKRYGISGYPTLKLFRGDREQNYTGGRDRQSIVQYMLQQATPPSMLVTSRKEVTRMMREIPQPLVLSFGSSEEDPVIKAHIIAAQAARPFPVRFAHSLSPGLAQAYGLVAGSTAILIPAWLRTEHDPEVKVHNINVEEEQSVVLAGLLSAARPLVGLRVKENEEWFHPGPGSLPLLAFYCDLEELGYTRRLVSGLAWEYQDRLLVAISNEEEYQQELAELGLGEWGEDVAVGLWAGPQERYAMTEVADEDTIREFVEAYFQHQLQPVLRSQPRPKTQSGPGEVVSVVGSTFHDVVLGGSQDVLVLFHAPWCSHCQAMEPTLRKLAKKYKKRKNLVIARFDATANDTPTGFELEGFPTLFFVRAGEDSPIRFKGQSRELEDLVAFVEDHRTSLRSKVTTRGEKDEL